MHHIRGTFGEHSGNIRGTFGEHLGGAHLDAAMHHVPAHSASLVSVLLRCCLRPEEGEASQTTHASSMPESHPDWSVERIYLHRTSPSTPVLS
eukprot:1190905-Prorocentrum_minimum.AAC.1